MRGVTWRSILIPCLIIPLNAYWLIQMEVVRYSAHPTTVSLLFNTIFILIVLTVLNALFAKMAPKRALNQAELLTIYGMVSIGTCIAGHDGLQVLVPMIPWPWRFADPTNKWDELFMGHFPEWLTLRDESVMVGYFEGSTNPYTLAILGPWLKPLLMWGLFVVLLMLVMLAVNSALRRQWLDREHLSCPLVSLPIEITNPKASLFKNHMLWIGIAVAGGIDIWNSISFHYPAIPMVPIEHQDMSIYFPGRPWNAIGWTPRSLYPFMVGMGVLMPTDFLFSCWFFYVFWKVERIAALALGWTQIPKFPFIAEQTFGAYAMFCLYGLWTSRRFLKGLAESTIRGARPQGMAPTHADESLLDDRNEPLSYRAAVLLASGAFIALVWFSSLAGMRLWVAVVFFIIYFGLSVAITRMRAQFGAPVHDLHWTGPDTIMPLVGGARAFTEKDLSVMGYYFWFNRAYRNHPMPVQLENYKLADRTETPLRPQFWAQVIAIVVGVASGFWAMIHLMYSYGARAKSRMSFGPESFNQLASRIAAPEGPNWWATGAIGVGLVFTLVLETLRLRFANWPFHPLGYAISGSWEMNLVWMPLMIAWLLKITLLRYGTFKLLRTCIPFFLGLIIGQFVVGSIVNIISIAFGVPSYMFWQ
ncbi:MAG TPA: DUF6785 family protein [Armatimonadota bacterium]|nr:DUF6785 family protein [Armatimonadota bacterium]